MSGGPWLGTGTALPGLAPPPGPAPPPGLAPPRAAGARPRVPAPVCAAGVAVIGVSDGAAGLPASSTIALPRYRMRVGCPVCATSSWTPSPTGRTDRAGHAGPDPACRLRSAAARAQSARTDSDQVRTTVPAGVP